jgi:integrase
VSVPVPAPAPDDALARLDARVAATLQNALAPNTWRAYAADWRKWSAWAADYRLAALPAQPLDLARYLVDEAERVKTGTLSRRLSAIRKAHLLAGHADPTDDPAVRAVLQGLRRDRTEPAEGKQPEVREPAPPLWTSDIERMMAATLSVPDPRGDGQGTAELRDRAMLLLLFTTAVRRSELAALDLAHLEPDPAGLIIHVGRSKTDQEGQGAFVGVPYAGRPHLCAVRAVTAWTARLAELLDLAPDQLSGPLFRPIDRHDRLGAIGAARRGPGSRLSDDAVRDIVVRRARAANLEPTHGTRFYSAHSTRAGFATQAAANGAHERDIMLQGRWKSLQVARGYIRRGSVFHDNAAGRLGL